MDLALIVSFLSGLPSDLPSFELLFFLEVWKLGPVAGHLCVAWHVGAGAATRPWLNLAHQEARRAPRSA
jgi:hypothetical protein